MLSNPKISVVIPFHNSETTLGKTLDSLVSQTMPDWEAILIDDASTDAGVVLVQERATKDPRLRLIQSTQQLGPARARNLGINNARARYVAFLDSDDLWFPDKLLVQLPVLEAGTAIVFSAYERVDSSGRVLRRISAQECVHYRDLLSGNPIGCLTAIWDREHFGHVQMPIVPMHEDYAFWLQLLRDGSWAIGLPQVLAQYRVSSKSHSGQKWRAARAFWTILRAEPNISFPRASLGFMRYATRAVLRQF